MVKYLLTPYGWRYNIIYQRGDDKGWPLLCEKTQPAFDMNGPEPAGVWDASPAVRLGSRGWECLHDRHCLPPTGARRRRADL